MDLWLIKRLGDTDYDEAAGFVVVAADETEARRAAAGQPGDNGGGTWLNDRASSAVRIGSAADYFTSATVLLCDFRAG